MYNVLLDLLNELLGLRLFDELLGLGLPGEHRPEGLHLRPSLLRSDLRLLLQGFLLLDSDFGRCAKWGGAIIAGHKVLPHDLLVSKDHLAHPAASSFDSIFHHFSLRLRPFIVGIQDLQGPSGTLREPKMQRCHSGLETVNLTTCYTYICHMHILGDFMTISNLNFFHISRGLRP